MTNPMQTHGAFSWMQLQTGEAEKAKQFYTSVLGWTSEDMSMGDMNYTVLINGETRIGGILPVPTDTPAWLGYVTVDDVDARTEKAKAAGATILQEPNTVPGVGRMATIADPAGGVIAFITYEAPAG